MRNKILVFKVLTLLTLSISSNIAFSQVFSADQNPPTLKWHQINTSNFQIIYPVEVEIEAQRMANTLENIIGRVSKSLNKTPKKISIILQNQGTTSNGFVQLAPRRSEFYTMPSQAFDFQNWLNSLAVHEMRHVVQFDKLTGRYNSPVFETLALAIFGINLPPWFYEGDAVNIETSLTKAGRGKQPEWPIYLRSNLLNKRKFSYSKNYFGSYKDFTPGYYQLGHFMNSKLRRDNGGNIMDSLFSRMSSFPIRPFNLSNSIKKFTGLTTRKLHDSTMDELQNLWQHQVDKNHTTTYSSLNKRSDNTPSHFLFPTAIEDGRILYLKESKGETPSLFLMDKNGRSKKIFRIGYQENPWLSYSSGKIVWDESRTAIRYQQQSFNVINIYDIKRKKARQLTHHSRMFAPALSPKADVIAAVDISYSNRISIVELDANSGKELKRYPSPQNYMLQMPSFNSRGDKLVIVGIGTTGKTLFELDRKSGSFRQLIPLQFQEILKPVYVNEDIVFKAHYNGLDNLYRLDTNGEIYQLTSARLGAFNPSFDAQRQQLLFNNFVYKGQDISSLPWKPQMGKKIKMVEDTFVDYSKPLYYQEGADDVFDSIPNRKFSSSRYSDLQLRNLFYFHSVYPLAGDGITGLELRSDNKLNTIGVYGDYQYNSSLKKSEYGAGFEFKKYYPILTVDYFNSADFIYRRGETTPVTWRQHEIKAELTIPFNFNKFNYGYSAGFKTGTSYSRKYDIDRPFNALPSEIKFPMHYQIYARRSSIRSSRDLAPKWAQSITLDYRHFPFENFFEGDLFTFKSSFYFPGIFRNHSFQASFNWQKSDGDYALTTDISRIRGYSFSRTSSSPDNTLLLNYRFPVFYPDWQLGPLAYIKRIKAGFFSDFQDVKRGNEFAPKSFGMELRADMNLLRFYLPNFDIGERIIFLNEKPNQNPIFEFMATYSF
ncbi:hypothetical protein [Desertivirga arenae]|uniref:hypothetical protein n=1 Tax=Desertivirga arenae TaxID=2810309 RepID=UPI001A965681|nr:hypothetical protein [Pedobacter sp. SYSU D00823]